MNGNHGDFMVIYIVVSVCLFNGDLWWFSGVDMDFIRMSYDFDVDFVA